jgi:hypothetical protein
MNSNVTSNKQHNNRPKDIENLGRTSRVRNKEAGHEKGGNGKAFKNDKNRRGKNYKGGGGNFIDVLKLEKLSYYTPAGREFKNCDLETVYQYYVKMIRSIFGIEPKHFIDKANLKKRVNKIVTDKENLLEIVKFLNKIQDEI